MAATFSEWRGECPSALTARIRAQCGEAFNMSRPSEV